VIDRTDVPNAFEFVTVAGARARQLLRGCTPKVSVTSEKPARIAQKEVKDGKIETVRTQE
jgi:DNA-directed RNA polymerase omega subunit